MKKEHAILCRKHGIEPSQEVSEAWALGKLVDALQGQLDEAAKQEPDALVECKQIGDVVEHDVIGWDLPAGRFHLYAKPINLPALIAQSKAEERERCAEFCEMYMAEWGGETIHLIPVTNRTHYGSAYAAAIRALQD